jgi:murein DD-endopeptidase MepM/ murein hydrolase activator NlpD
VHAIRRILVIALAAAAVFAAILGAVSTAQDPAPTSSPESTPTTVAATPDQTETPVETTTPAQTPAETPTEAPTEAPTQAPTSTPDESPAPMPSPVETTVAATPTPADASPASTPGAAPKKGIRAKTNAAKKNNAEQKTVDTAKCSTSTSSRDCGAKKPAADDRADQHEPKVKLHAPQLTTSTGAPAPTNPTFALATPGPARIGVPNFFIDKFRIPPFLLSIYQAAGMQYGVRWEVLAAINEIETDYGRNLNVSYAGALGWMQFMPSTWKLYGVDANRDGVKDPYNPVDAIFAAARYLRAAGADKDLRRAIFAYNHADWYVDSVLLRARVIGGLPSDLVGSLTGLTQGRFPVHAKATYAGSLTKADRHRRVRAGANAAMVVDADQHRRGIDIFARKGAPVIAVNDGRIVRIGKSKRLGRFVKLLDVYGNTYTYAHLGSVSKTYPSPKKRTAKRADIRRELKLDKAPKAAASETKAPAHRERKAAPKQKHKKQRLAANAPKAKPAAAPAKERLFAHPARPNARVAGGAAQLGDDLTPAGTPAGTAPLGLDKRDFVSKPMRRGARVIGGTILGRIGAAKPGKASHLRFEIRPAGRGAPRVDPKPILDGWKLLESTAVYRAADKNPFIGEDAENPSIGQILLMSKTELSQRVLNDPRIEIYACGQADIRSGQIDRRVLATLEFLASSGLKPTVSSLKCGHGYLTTSGNVSEHTTGTAVDIAAVNGIPILGHQGAGSITDITIQRLLTLQGTMKPHQIISLMTFKDADNTFAMGDHDDHIHVGWRPLYGQSKQTARRIDAILRPQQWIKLIDRIGAIDNPEVREQPSKFSIAVTKNASSAHRGE